MKYYNEFKDIKVGDEVQWNSSTGKATKGLVRYVSQEFECFSVAWCDNSVDNSYSTTDTKLGNNLRRVIKVDESKQGNVKDSTENKIKELIIHLVQANQTERACEALEVLRKYLKSTGM